MPQINNQTRPEVTAPLSIAEAMGPPGPQSDEHMMVDVALSVAVSARVQHLVFHDEDGRCSGLVTQAELAAHRNGSSYTDHTRLRDLPCNRGPFPSTAEHLSDVEASMRHRDLRLSPVIDEDGYTLGVLGLTP
ncbi:hypothetical protein [Streptomyces cacaoi]|uniref:hypothetical protein n=1 Tax=Streptomyces cacaoi TaxID=1898 RepID=UPI00263741A2|nr:hypothetical protein [Streptomyces cacaoi]